MMLRQKILGHVCKDHLDEYVSRKRSDTRTATEALVQKCIKQNPTHLCKTLNKGHTVWYMHWNMNSISYVEI